MPENEAWGILRKEARGEGVPGNEANRMPENEAREMPGNVARDVIPGNEATSF